MAFLVPIRALTTTFSLFPATGSHTGRPTATIPSRLVVHETTLNLEDLTKVLSANICVDSLGQPRSAPLLLHYQSLVGSFLEGSTVPQAQAVRIKPTTLFVAQPATVITPPEHPDLIPTGEAKKPRRAVFEVIAPEQSAQSAKTDSAAREKLTRPAPVVHLDEPDVVTKPPLRAKRARTEAKAPKSPGPSSSAEVWVPELTVGRRPITAQDSVLDPSDAEHAAKVAHALGVAICLPRDIQIWNEMPSGRMFCHIARGFTMAAQGIFNMESRVYDLEKDLKRKEAEHTKAMAKDTEEKAKVEAKLNAKMDAEVAKLREKMRLLEAECIKSIGKAREEGKLEGNSTPIPFPDAGLRASKDEAEDEEDSETEEAGPELEAQAKDPALLATGKPPAPTDGN
uniref:Uncharacterized protein n=1 Tax=Fagus sylvatica TaxID=28930 RepID=A0A2N9EYR4_FAGSY